MGDFAEDGERFFERHGHEMFEIPEREYKQLQKEVRRTKMDIRFNQDDRFFAHDGVNPAPGDDDPKPHVVEPEEDDEEDDDDDTDEEEDDDESEDDEDDDED